VVFSVSFVEITELLLNFDKGQCNVVKPDERLKEPLKIDKTTVSLKCVRFSSLFLRFCVKEVGQSAVPPCFSSSGYSIVVKARNILENAYAIYLWVSVEG